MSLGRVLLRICGLMKNELTGEFKEKLEVTYLANTLRSEMKKYCLESRSRGISYMKYANGRRTGLVTFCVETAFYNGLLKERYKEG